MGAISFFINDQAKPKEVLLQYVQENLSEQYELLDHAFGSAAGSEWGGVLYAATRNKETDAVGAEVILFKVAGRQSRQLAVKWLDDTVGPNQLTCPLRIIKRLTETDNRYATEWRENVVRAHERRKAARNVIGKTISLAQPLRYGDGLGDVSVVKVESLTKWKSDHYLLRPPRDWWLRNYEVLETGSQP